MARYYSVLLLFLIFSASGLAQDVIKISEPELELIDNILYISFDIESKAEDEFRVWIEATDSEGRKISASSLRGDIGENVNGGSGKKILWDIVADKVEVSGGLYIQVFAERIKTAVVQKPETLVNKATELRDEEAVKNDISIAGACLRSAVFPGWGLSYATGKKIHLLKGFLSYGCIGASVLYNRKGTDSYNSYLDAITIEDRETHFNNSINEDKLSEATAYVAIGVWLADMVWTAVGASNAKTTSISLDARFDSMTGITVLAVSYKF